MTAASGERDLVETVASRERTVAVVTAVSVVAALGGAIVTALLRQYDLRVYVMGARHVLDGRLYDVTLPVKPYLPFTYPPISAMLFWPLVPMPFPVAKMVWAFVNVGALVGFTAVSLHAVRPDLSSRRVWRTTAFLIGFVFWLEPVRLNFHFGQINLVLGLAVLADLTTTLTVRGKTLPRGVLLGAAAAVKLIPLIFVVYLAATRQWRAARTAAFTFLACTALAFAITPRSSWRFWTHYVVDAKRVGTVYYLSNQSLRGALDRIAHRELSESVTTAVAAVVALAGLALAVAVYRRGESLLAVLVTATTGILVSPISWSHHLVWIVPILLWLALSPARPRFGAAVAAVCCAVFWWGPIWIPDPRDGPLLHEKFKALVESNTYCALLIAFLCFVAWSRLVATRPRSLDPT